MKKKAFSILTLLIIFSTCISYARDKTSCPDFKTIEFEVITIIERSDRNFTEGFQFYQGSFYESTGAFQGNTQLNLLKINGKQEVLSEDIQHGTFGEGLAIFAGQIYQATWKDHLLFVFDITGSYLRTMNLPFETWGLTTDGSDLFITDGSPTLRVLNASDLSVIRELTIRTQELPLYNVNELEWINNKIYGNLFQTNSIVRIEPSTGCVDGILDASVLYSLLPNSELKYLSTNNSFVLNGIAYDSSKGEMYLTGKNWKYIFKIKIN